MFNEENYNHVIGNSIWADYIYTNIPIDFVYLLGLEMGPSFIGSSIVNLVLCNHYTSFVVLMKFNSFTRTA